MPHFDISVLPIYAPWFRPYRYKVAYGGRGGGKSWAFALALVIKAMSGKYRILCCREYQANIRASVHQLLRDTIARYGVSKYFNVTHTEITCTTGSQFIFKGLFQSPNEIKSLEGIDFCWVEEAQSVSKQSWDVLIPTIRKESSEIWVSFNPDLETDETYHRFILTPRDNALVLKVNYGSNPFLPQVLREEIDHCKRTDPDAYKNIWEGECRKYSDAQIFKDKFVIEDFITPDDAVFYYGADWGFSQDPSTLIRCFMQDNVLYIDREAYAVGVELDQLPSLYRTIEGVEFARIMADNSRPETIKHMKRRGFNIRAAKKWGGSVADGIAILKSFDRIVIHPRCRHTADEFRFYSYKVDKLSGEIFPIIEDKWNHCIDALRYALDAYIHGRGVVKP